MKIKIKRIIRRHSTGPIKLVRTNKKTELHEIIEKKVLNRKMISMDMINQKKNIYTSLSEINETIVEIEFSNITLYVEYYKGIYSIALNLENTTSPQDSYIYKLIKTNASKKRRTKELFTT